MMPARHRVRIVVTPRTSGSLFGALCIAVAHAAQHWLSRKIARDHGIRPPSTASGGGALPEIPADGRECQDNPVLLLKTGL